MTEPDSDRRTAVASLVQGAAPTTVGAVVQRLSALQEVMETSHGRPENPVAAFNDLYRTITQAVDDRLTAGAFADPEFMVALDLRFAERYFNAIDQWNDQDAWAPRCWSALFDRWDDDLVPFLGATAGVTAHIKFDLAPALVQTFRQVGGPVLDDSPERRADYDMLNDIFAEKIPPLRRGLLKDNRFADWFDRATGNLDDVFQAASIEAARDASWTLAGDLWDLREDADRYAAQIRTLDGRTKAIIVGLFFLLDSPLGDIVLRPE